METRPVRQTFAELPGVPGAVVSQKFYMFLCFSNSFASGQLPEDCPLCRDMSFDHVLSIP